MDRTESNIIQVAPNYENNKIKEMEMFGWNLQGRQEIHEEGDAYGEESMFGNSYTVTTKVSHYVKLHFVRSLSLPNIEKIKAIEAEYYSKNFPPVPTIKSFILPALLLFFGVISLLNPDVGSGFMVFLIFGGIGGWLIYSKLNKRKRNIAICEDSLKAQDALIAELKSL